MLMYGYAEIYPLIADENQLVFNITSMIESYPRLLALIPPNSLGHLNQRDFDIAYMNYIMSNDFVFKQFFDIVYSLYIGKDVYLIINSVDWSENIVESLLKLIQQRYGYNSIRINTFDDYIFASNNYIGTFNSDYGLKNLDIDRERYTYIVEAERIKNGGKAIIDES